MRFSPTAVSLFVVLGLSGASLFSHTSSSSSSSSFFAVADLPPDVSAPLPTPDTLVGQLSPSDLSLIDSTSEKFEFQAEVTRLMDIVINSLYKNKEIFLRELISNASDALDKIRFLSISDPSLLGSKPELGVRVSFDKEARTITIADTGVGMTRVELIDNLGTVAKSGTTNFMEKLGGDGAAHSDLSMIGQFGVGFYSIYLVSDRVAVASKSNDDPVQHVWSSTADGNFIVSDDPRGNTLGRGTEITMYLKDDASEFLSDERLEQLVKRYSEFITFPIYIRKATNDVEDVIPDGYEKSEDEEDEAQDLDDEDDEDEDDEDEDSADGKKDGADKSEEDVVEMELKKKETWKYQWVKANTNVAIWSRDKEDITDEEYSEFYQNLAKDGTRSKTWIHFKAEGEVDFKGILYVPSEAEHNHYDKYYEKDAKIRLYVRKVLINDEFKDLVPQYLNFLRGVVDSDDLPLNVNREALQQSKILKVMGKKLVRKALEMLRKLSEGDKDFSGYEDGDGDEPSGKKRLSPYLNFWKHFGKSIKLGIIEDSSNRSKLVKLARFVTSKDGADHWRSLDEYVADMKEWQTAIYYIAGQNVAEVEKSPFLEKLKKKGVEVLYLIDPIDEYAVSHMTEFDGKRLMSVSKEGLKFGDEDEKMVKRRDDMYKAKFLPLTDYLKALYAGPEKGKEKVGKVKVSNRLEDTPAVIVTGMYGNSANMERIMKAQAFSNDASSSFLMSAKTMELNARHPLVSKMLQLVQTTTDEDSNDNDGAAQQQLSDIAWMLFDTACLASGFSIDDVEPFTARMHRVMKTSLKVENMELEPELEVPDDEEEEEEEEEEKQEREGEDEEEKEVAGDGEL